MHRWWDDDIEIIATKTQSLKAGNIKVPHDVGLYFHRNGEESVRKPN